MKKAMLREKKRTIEEELGEMNEEGEITNEEYKEYKNKIKESGMTGDVKVRAEKELKRLGIKVAEKDGLARLFHKVRWGVNACGREQRSYGSS